METFPATGRGLDTAGSSSTAASTRPISRQSSSASRSSSATPSNSTRLTTPELPKTPIIARPRLLAELPKFPSHGTPEVAHEAISRKDKEMTARPGLTRHHTTEALRSPHSHSTQSAPRSTFFSPALATSNISPRRSSPIRSMLGSDLNHGYLYPQRGDGRKRAASLDDLRPSSDAHKAFSAESSVPTDLPFPLPLPTAVPISSPQSDSGTTNRSKSHGVRRWHTLMELVSTEEGYVKDLKVLVRIYLENLSLVVALEPEARDEIARNADALLTLHKKIYRRLQRVVTEEQLKELGPNKGSIEAQRRVDKAASRVASIFIKEAASFHLYEAFCAGHSQALDLIRQVQGLPEWDMYEKRCAVIVADERANAKALKSPEPAQTPITIIRSPSSPIISFHHRRHSTDVAPKISLTLPGASKLTISDFLIKPIQRICKYPLMLGQLLAVNEDEDGTASSRSLRDSGNMSVSHGQVDLIEVQALEAMKQVATKVDEARRRTDVAIKSRLIVERVSEQILPQLGSFGHCLLAGSLDVVYHHETIAPLTTPIKVKYLGAFLYGGWLLLVKVLKNKVYEPRYWFPLFDVYMTDIAEEDALLPSSFRLSSGEHHFEFAAACLQEKNVWMDQIKVARTQATSVSNPLSSLDEGSCKPSTPTQVSFRPPSRKNTAPSSLPPSGGVFPTMIPPPGDVLVTPPKRRSSLGVLDGSIMALENPGLASLITVEGVPDNWELPPSPTSPSDQFVPRALIRSNTAPDSSVVSMTPNQIKSLLEGEASTILIRRASTNHRKMVDQSLQDVFFEECQAVRIAAQMKEPLFQPPKLTTDTGSALSARNRMMKRDSVLLKRQKSVAEPITPLSGYSPSMKSSSSRFALSRNKSAGAVGNAKELRRRTLAIPSFSFFEQKEEDYSRRPRTADSTAPTIAVTPDDASDAITFRTKRERGKRESRQREELSEKALPDKPFRPQTFHGSTEPAFLKELPPTPDVKTRRRNTIISPPSRRYDEADARFSTLPARPFMPRAHTDEYGQMPVQVYPIGQGLSNANPAQLGQGQSPKGKSRLHPESIFRRSLTLFGSKRTKSNPGAYFAGLFNRSAISVQHNDSNSTLRARSEPPPSPQKRLSASTPALKEALSNWELIPSVSLLKRSDTKAARLTTSQSSCSTDVQSPFNSHATVTVPATESTPLPPLPRHTQTLQPQKPSLRRRSSQIIQHLNPLSQLSN